MTKFPIKRIGGIFTLFCLLQGALGLQGCQAPTQNAPKRETQQASSCVQLEKTSLCATSGSYEVAKGMMETSSVQTRGLLTTTSQQGISLLFSYKGPPEEVKAFRSGLKRQQIGVKVKAQDSCNLIYVMWRFGEKDSIVVSRKLNPGQHSHKECLNHGYKTIATLPAPKIIREGEFHRLNVSIDKNQLKVMADGENLWQGILEEELSQLQGPLGIRTDNGKFVFKTEDWNPSAAASASDSSSNSSTPPSTSL